MALAADPPARVELWPAALRLWRDPWPPRRYAVYLDWAAAVAEHTGRTPEEVEISAAALGRRLLRPAPRPVHPCGDCDSTTLKAGDR